MANDAYENLAIELADEEGVTTSEQGLLVHGTLFAYLDGSDLIVDLPEKRADDLKKRGVAESFSAPGESTRTWVRVFDEQLWPELAREAHEFVGEPPVGGES